MSSCCLTKTDSATTDRRPPGPISRAGWSTVERDEDFIQIPGVAQPTSAAVRRGSRTGHRYEPARDRGTRSDGAGRRRRTRAHPGPGCGCIPEGWMPLAGAGPHPPAGRRLTVAASGLMPGGRAARDEDGIHEGCVATFKKRQESDGSGRAGAVSCNHPEQLVDELNLSPTIRTAHPPRLPLPDHVHGLVALDRSPRRVECTKALLRCHASFDRSMIRLHDVVRVLDRSVAQRRRRIPAFFTPAIAEP